MARHLIKHWKGTAASYGLLKRNNMLSPWTKYVVVEVDNQNNQERVIAEYYGENIVSIPTGQLLPVNEVYSDASSIPANDKTPFSRFLVGTDALGYKIIEYQPVSGGNPIAVEMDFDEKYGVRIKSRDYKNYIYFNNKLVSYDDVDCGTF